MGRPGDDRPGGSASLAAFLSDHQDAVEADLLRYYQIDLPRDLGSDRLTWRRLGLLIRHLPPEAATVREVHGDKAMWTLDRMLMALIADYLAVANWQRGNAGKKNPPPAPRQIDRPGVVHPGERRFGSRPQPVEVIRERLRKLNRR